jgi:GDP-L-fucose synthase
MWGSGEPEREFLYVDDLADACVYLMNNYSDESHLNIGTGEDVKIIELAQIIKRVVGYEGEIVNDISKPDGTPKKLLDVTNLHRAGWKHKIDLEEGIKRVYDWYLTAEDIRK